MKLIFAGSSEFAIPALEMLIKHTNHEIALVISQPARPKGRNRILEDTPLARYAIESSLKLLKPEQINSIDTINTLDALDADLLITASYGAFIGKKVRELCPLGAINLHPSLLPKYRGASPIQSALLEGESITGNSIFLLEKHMDSGPILLQEELKIGDNENYSSLHDRLAMHAAALLKKLLSDFDKYPPMAQDHNLATYTKKIERADLKLDPSLTAGELLPKIRAFSFEPGAYLLFRDKPLKILEAELLEEESDLPPGSITEIIKNEGFCIATGKDQMKIRIVQASGKRIMPASAWLLGSRAEVEEILK